jgi:hypothetical protein
LQISSLSRAIEISVLLILLYLTNFAEDKSANLIWFSSVGLQK